MIAPMLCGATVVAHNASFEPSAMSRELDRCGLRWTAPMFCTLRFARQVLPDAPRHGLGALAERFGIPQARPHRAWSDVMVNLGVFRALTNGWARRAVERTVLSARREVRGPPQNSQPRSAWSAML